MATTSGKKTVLLIEDEDWVNALLKLMLEREGYQVLAARTGQGALDLLEREKIQVDLLLADIVLPLGLSGLRLARQLQATHPLLKVIFITGYEVDVVAKDLPAELRHQVVQKPFDPNLLMEFVRSTLVNP